MNHRKLYLSLLSLFSINLFGCSGFNWNPSWENRAPSGIISVAGATTSGINWTSSPGTRLTFVCNATDPDQDTINYRWSLSFVEPTPTPTPVISASPTPSPSPIPTPSPTATPTPSASPAPTPGPSASPVPTPTPVPIAEQQRYEWIVPDSMKGKKVTVSCLVFDDRGAQTIISIVIDIQ